MARIEERRALGPEPALEIGHDRQRVGRQDDVTARDARADDLDAGREVPAHQRSDRRTVASISPCGSVVATKISDRFSRPNGVRS